MGSICLQCRSQRYNIRPPTEYAGEDVLVLAPKIEYGPVRPKAGVSYFMTIAISITFTITITVSVRSKPPPDWGVAGPLREACVPFL